MDLVIRGGTIVTAADSFRADVAVDEGRIAVIGRDLPKAERQIDANGLLVMPGGIDVHTHLGVKLGDVVSVDDFESGTAAAACGGITTICDYAWQLPGQSLHETVAANRATAAPLAHVDYGFHVVISEARPEVLAEVRSIVEAGYPSLKVFTINEFGIGDVGLLQVFKTARDAGAIVNVHAENGDMIDIRSRELLAQGHSDPRYFAQSRPALAEAEATRRAIAYAEFAGAEVYIVHLSCADALAAVRSARKRNLPVWAETRPIYLALTDDCYAPGGLEAAKLAGAPPIRSAADQAALWDGLRSGDLQVVGSDNTSWTPRQKMAGLHDFTSIPYGVPGLETEMAVIFSEGVSKGRISANTFVAVFATNPARIFGFYPRKGTIAIGSDADMVLFDPARTYTIDATRLHSRAGYDPFEGLTVTGAPVLTLSRGEVIAGEGRLLSEPGRGEHLVRRRLPSSLTAL